MITLSRTRGIGGVIKARPEDFVVKEITGKGVTLEPSKSYNAGELREEEENSGKFTTFVLQKTNWETNAAILGIAKRLGRGRKSIGYAGSKDKLSVSVQLACLFGSEPEQVLGIRIKDISINGAWKSNGIELGSNIGNAFDVVITKTDFKDNKDQAGKIAGELNGKMPNYYDKQRFGLRMNNAGIGIRILKGEIEEAMMDLLTNTDGEKNKDAIEARERLRGDQNFEHALEYFPRYLRIERSVIGYMAQYNNSSNALRKVPRGISIMFIHAVQSLIFNMALEKRIKEQDFNSQLYCKSNFYGFPDQNATASSGDYPVDSIIGYNTEDKFIGEYESEIMQKMGITKESFKIKHMPELSMKGAVRPILVPVKGLSCKQEEPRSIEIGFSIPAGAYATVLINEFTKNQELNLLGMLNAIEKNGSG